MSYLYETHLHTFPVSRCGYASVRENLEFYKSLGYDGVFITNHFIESFRDKRSSGSYEQDIQYFCSDYEDGVEIGKEIGLRVFFAWETSTGGSDFLVYGLDKQWLLAHPEILDMKKREQLEFFGAEGALVIQAHPYREAKYIDHIRLFPRSVHGVEVINACRTDFENEMAAHYAKSYELLPFAGSDNHYGAQRPTLTGMRFDSHIDNEAYFVRRIKVGEGEMFFMKNPTLGE